MLPLTPARFRRVQSVGVVVRMGEPHQLPTDRP